MVCLPYRPEEPELCVYHQTKWRAYYEVAKPMIEDGLLLVIVQLGAVYGPEDKEYGSIREPFRNWVTGDRPMLPREVTTPYDYVMFSLITRRQNENSGLSIDPWKRVYVSILSGNWSNSIGKWN
jgi:hypothetical protein